MRAEKKLREVYKNKETMRVIYEGFENRLNEYGKKMTGAKKSNKTLHSVLARWTSMDKRNLEKIAEMEDVDSKDDKEDEGYSSDKGSNLLSKRWSKKGKGEPEEEQIAQ